MTKLKAPPKLLNVRNYKKFDLKAFRKRRVYSTGLQGQVWQKTQVSQGNIFLAFLTTGDSVRPLTECMMSPV